ncbi:MAG: SRPBCC domain-containing protein [Actinomycetia bacterium]|nr:SRPBCC domain-containing protein [Actinomycetes bacterium]
MRHHIESAIEIEATPEAVWAILTDLGTYPEWNPTIPSSKGTAAVGEKLINRMQTRNGKSTTFKPTVTVADTNSTLEWLGHFFLPGIFDGRHRFDLEETPDGTTKFTQSEDLSGVLVPFMRKYLDNTTLVGFQEMNQALKVRAETGELTRSPIRKDIS